MKKDDYKTMLDELCEGCNTEYCFLKEFVIESKPSKRLLMQIKMIEKYKYELSSKAGRDVGWQEAINSWAEDGYAKIFSDVYDEKKRYTALYKEIMNYGNI